MPISHRIPAIVFLSALSFLAPSFTGGGGPGAVRAQEAPLTLGDCNADLRVDISDVVYILQYLFVGTVTATRPSCDFSPNGRVDIADAINLVSYLLLGGPPPKPPKYYSVELAWDPVNRDEGGSPEQVAGYRIYFFDRGFRVLVKEVNDCACATLNDLSRGVEYRVGVTAVDLSGNESDSSEKVTVER